MIRTAGMFIRGSASEYTGVFQLPSGNWNSKISVSPSSRECANRDICLIYPLSCFSQVGYAKQRNLGTYNLQEDAARAYDKVARILERPDLNLPKSDGLDINGPRSNGADESVAALVGHTAVEGHFLYKYQISSV